MRIVKYSVNNYMAYNKNGDLVCTINDVKEEIESYSSDGENKIVLTTVLDHQAFFNLFCGDNVVPVNFIRNCLYRDVGTDHRFIRTEEFEAIITGVTRHSVAGEPSVFDIFLTVTSDIAINGNN